jgi:hypothetical protein
MNVINLTKNKYVNGGIIDETFLSLINRLSNNNNLNTLKSVSKIIKNPISLSTIFKKNKINYSNIKYIIFGLPKTGNSSLNKSIKQIVKGSCEVLFFHSIVELLRIDFNFINYTINDVIEFISENSKHMVHIITSYRKPEDRCISKYFHNIKYKPQETQFDKDTKIITKENLKLIVKRNEFNVFYNTIFKEELSIVINNNSYYNKDHGIGIYRYKKNITFVFTCLEDFDKFEKNIGNYIPQLSGLKITCENKNTSPIYLNTPLVFDDETRKIIRDREKAVLDFYKL